MDVEWLNIGVLDDYEECNYCPFMLDDNLFSPEKLFIFLLEKTYGKGSWVVGVEGLEEGNVITIAVPID